MTAAAMPAPGSPLDPAAIRAEVMRQREAVRAAGEKSTAANPETLATLEADAEQAAAAATKARRATHQARQAHLDASAAYEAAQTAFEADGSDESWAAVGAAQDELRRAEAWLAACTRAEAAPIEAQRIASERLGKLRMASQATGLSLVQALAQEPRTTQPGKPWDAIDRDGFGRYVVVDATEDEREKWRPLQDFVTAAEALGNVLCLVHSLPSKSRAELEAEHLESGSPATQLRRLAEPIREERAYYGARFFFATARAATEHELHRCAEAMAAKLRRMGIKSARPGPLRRLAPPLEHPKVATYRAKAEQLRGVPVDVDATLAEATKPKARKVA